MVFMRYTPRSETWPYAMPEYTIAWPEKETMECMVCALRPIARRLVTATEVRMCLESLRAYSHASVVPRTPNSATLSDAFSNTGKI